MTAFLLAGNKILGIWIAKTWKGNRNSSETQAAVGICTRSSQARLQGWRNVCPVKRWAVQNCRAFKSSAASYLSANYDYGSGAVDQHAIVDVSQSAGFWLSPHRTDSTARSFCNVWGDEPERTSPIAVVAAGLVMEHLLRLVSTDFISINIL